MKLSQFDLISTPTGNETVRLNHGKNRTYIYSDFSLSASFPSNLNQPKTTKSRLALFDIYSSLFDVSD